MKKTYSKPALYAESFELAEHIAACSGFNPNHRPTTSNHWSSATCVFELDTGWTLFNDSSICQITDTNSVIINCYNTVSEGAGTPFGS